MFVKIKRGAFKGCQFPIIPSRQKTYPVDIDFQKYQETVIYSIAAELGIGYQGA